MQDEKKTWGRPQDGPWWRFVPKNRLSGMLGILAGVLLLVQVVIVLSDGPSGGQVALEVVCALLACGLLLRSVDGLRVLGRREGRH